MPKPNRNPHYGWIPDYAGLSFALEALLRDASALSADDRALLAWQLREHASRLAAGQVAAPSVAETS